MISKKVAAEVKAINVIASCSKLEHLNSAYTYLYNHYKLFNDYITYMHLNKQLANKTQELTNGNTN